LTDYEELGKKFYELMELYFNSPQLQLKPVAAAPPQPERPIQEQIASALVKHNLDPLSVEFSNYGNSMKIQMRKFVASELWQQYNAVMRDFGFKWVTDKNDKKNSGWERGE
jgi:hypothetical protein